jgi:hypothetical protein
MQNKAAVESKKPLEWEKVSDITEPRISTRIFIVERVDAGS